LVIVRGQLLIQELPFFNKIWKVNLLLYVEQLNGQPIFILEPLLNHITLCVDTLFPIILDIAREFSAHFDPHLVDRAKLYT
jgi:hypothetical protein